MTHKYGAGFLVSAYLVLGVALIPMQNLTPSSFQNVVFKECHWGCKPGHTPCERTYLCSSTTKPHPSGAYNPTTGPTGSTGPTKPAPPTTGRHQQ
jgi:hypothetical protein